jgi:hypothetical protein
VRAPDQDVGRPVGYYLPEVELLKVGILAGQHERWALPFQGVEIVLENPSGLLVDIDGRGDLATGSSEAQDEAAGSSEKIDDGG